MRKIKFRAWINWGGTQAKDKMVKVSSWDSFGNIGTTISRGGTRYVKPIALMQYTGLKDKYGKEIYEGDILAHRYDSMKPKEKSFVGVVEYHADKIIEIGWENDATRFTGFVLKGSNRPLIDEDYFSNISHMGEYEVIGNVYENPTLWDALHSKDT